jgi:hypothetical protein
MDNFADGNQLVFIDLDKNKLLGAIFQGDPLNKKGRFLASKFYRRVKLYSFGLSLVFLIGSSFFSDSSLFDERLKDPDAERWSVE